ncbi:MAG TPA: ribokinase [Candidatus Limnocylindrales bacterium]|nr:ribokinase [Candidatus Limnocylindrales bacterium]
MSGRVLIVGSVNVDLVVQTDRLPLPGETVVGGTFRRFHGGKGGNQAVAAARLGVPVMLVAALGDDEFGSEARAALAREGIGTDVLVTLDHTATGVALILVDSKAENQIAVAPGANALLTSAHVRTALSRLHPHAGDAVIVTHEISTDAAREALRLGRAGGAWTILNPAPADGLDRSLISLADVVVPNRGELARLVADDARRSGRPTTGAEEPVKAARTLLEATAEGPGAGHAILVTLGSAGAVLVRREGPAIDIKAPKVKAIDATGAGDALNGALAAALAGGLGLEQAARRAVVAASISVTRAGAREGYPTLDELSVALGETPPSQLRAAAAAAAAEGAGGPGAGTGS